ncbi:uncharacterized protein LOC126803560 [Argentina anserina]|uniref:uncharacterized protein LOC126803560 n=1 Tax=Argentina anserina TaxID=57926 RepID=UPI0021768547|nr:uncharacterized protein LOC126803560 [Potentilla anserina]
MPLSAMQNWSIGTIRSKRDLPPAHFALKIQGYSLLAKTEAEKYYSGVFEAGGHKWKLNHPNGDPELQALGKAVSLYLYLDDWKSLPPKRAILQNTSSGYWIKYSLVLFLSQENGLWTYGYANFLTLEKVHEESNGFIKDDTLNVEVEFLTISVSKVYSWEITSVAKHGHI